MNNKSKMLILLEQKKDGELLSGFLSKSYDIILASKLPDESLRCDLIIVDGITHNHYKQWISDQKAQSNPVFLPVLILTGKKDVDIATSYLWKTIDELIVLPVNKTELMARVEMLLRAREQSVQLDITHKKLIQENKNQLKIAVNAANVGLFDWNLETNDIYYSPEWKQQIGFDDHEIINDIKEWEQRIHPDDLNTFKELMSRYINAPWPDYNVEYRFRHKNGHYIWIYSQASLFCNDDGKAVRMVGSHIDITERKKTEEQLKLLSRSVEQSPISVLITDDKGNIMYVNPGFTKITGYSQKEVIGENPRILKSGNQSAEFYQELWNTIYEGKDWYGEFLNKKKNGESYWAQTIISPILDNKGLLTHLLAIQEDITDKKRTLNELIIAKEKAEESNHLKTAFLNNLSHEIRTPMNAILGFTELLKKPDLKGAQKDKFLEIVEHSSNRLLSTITDIIEISQIETDASELQLSVVKIHELLEESFQTFKPLMDKVGLEFILTSSIEEIYIQTDKEKVKSILLNLLNNALKFTKKGTVVLGGDLKDSSVIIYVKDEGAGIPPDRLDSIFESFVQADLSLKRPMTVPDWVCPLQKHMLKCLPEQYGSNRHLTLEVLFIFLYPQYDDP